MNCRGPVPMTEFDIATTDETTLMMKALIWYLDYPLQRNLAVIIRFKELSDTIKYYNNPSCRFCEALKSSDAILDNLLNYCPQDMSESINAIRQMTQFSNIMNMYKSTEQNPDFQSIINMMNEISSNGCEGSAPLQNNPDVSTHDNMQDGMRDITQNNTQFSPYGSDFAENIMNDEQKKMYDKYMDELDEFMRRNNSDPEIRN